MQIDNSTNNRILKATPRDILIRYNLKHGWGVLQLKHLIELYDFERIDKVIRLAYRYNTLIYKCRMIKQTPISTHFNRKYYDTYIENLINGKHIQEVKYMTALAKNKINTLARVLKNKNIVEFKNNNLYYEVFLSADSGYVVNIYNNDVRDDEGELIETNIIDGGLCEGSAKDAIEFML